MLLLERPMFLLIAGFLVLTLILLGCRSSSKLSGDPIPADFNLEWGEGGGFTGLWSGFTVTFEGAIQGSRGLPGSIEDYDSGQFSDEELAELWAEIRELGLDTLKMTDRGNMTASIRMTAEGATNSLTFTPGLKGVEDSQHDLETFYRKWSEIASSKLSDKNPS